MDNSIYLILKIVPKADQVAQFLEIFNNLAVDSRKEEGCVYYKLSQNIANQNEYYLLEEWKSKIALEAHEKTPHFIRLVPQFRETIQEITRIQTSSI